MSVTTERPAKAKPGNTTKASPAKVAANRANAQKSTGPRTDAGKERAKQNACKHGLCAAIPLLSGEDEEALNIRRETWLAALGPSDPIQFYIAETIVAASWQMDRARKLEAQYAEPLPGAVGPHTLLDLATNPLGTLARLHGTTEGTKWLIERWAVLGRDLLRFGFWGASQIRLMLDLLGGASITKACDDPDVRRRLGLAFDAGWGE